MSLAKQDHVTKLCAIPEVPDRADLLAGVFTPSNHFAVWALLIRAVSARPEEH